MGMARKLSIALGAGALVLAGCGSQSPPKTGAAAKPAPKLSRAQVYLKKQAEKKQFDNEGPEHPRPGSAPTWSYNVKLAGPNGLAKAVISLRGKHVCWRFDGARSKPSAAAIHVGSRGKSGRVLVVFGARFTPRGCIVVAPVVVNSIAAAPHFYYLSLLTPRGALRSQL